MSVKLCCTPMMNSDILSKHCEFDTILKVVVDMLYGLTWVVVGAKWVYQTTLANGASNQFADLQTDVKT
jgi:hypothetical protein